MIEERITDGQQSRPTGSGPEGGPDNFLLKDPDLLKRYRAAGGRYLVCPICFDAKGLDKDELIDGAELGGTVPMWQWIGDEGAVTFSY